MDDLTGTSGGRGGSCELRTGPNPGVERRAEKVDGGAIGSNGPVVSRRHSGIFPVSFEPLSYWRVFGLKVDP